MGAALAGQKLTATYINTLVPLGEVQSTNNSTPGTTTSTSYTDTLGGSGVVSVNFTAPLSGIVDVRIEAACTNSNALVYTTASFRLSGASTVAASDDYQVYNQGTGGEARFMAETRITGLTPGGSYTATMQHKVSANTGTFNHRRISVRPIGA